MGTITQLNKYHTPEGLTQLPISCYSQPKVFALEQQSLFARAPAYVGHANMVANTGDYHVLDWMQNARMLVNNGGKISLLSNICRHRQAIMLNGHGNTQNIVCPLHRWTYNTQGKLLGAPKFEQNPCLHLDNTELAQWQGLLFQTPHAVTEELQQLGCKQDFDFNGFMFDSAHIDHYNFGWKTFIETYLEDYHVGPFHPGLSQFVNCDDLHWEFGKNYSVQTVGYQAFTQEHGSPTYQRWQHAVTQFQADKAPKYGAIWFVYYPYLMLEWYPNVLVVSHLIPTGVNSCSNVVEFYYPEEIALFERDYIAAQQAAYHETAIEDQEICDRMQQGRLALAAQGLDERGPYQHPLESGLQHFHAWYRTQMAAHLQPENAS